MTRYGRARPRHAPGDREYRGQTEEKDILFGVWGEVEQAGHDPPG